MSKKMSKDQIRNAILEGVNPTLFIEGLTEELQRAKYYGITTPHSHTTKDAPLLTYTVVLNSVDMGVGIPHVSHVETSVRARNFDEAVNLVKLLKFEVELEITSITKDHHNLRAPVKPYDMKVL